MAARVNTTTSATVSNRRVCRITPDTRFGTLVRWERSAISWPTAVAAGRGLARGAVNRAIAAKR